MGPHCVENGDNDCMYCRLAHPIDRLRTKYDDFQHRMVTSCLIRLEHHAYGVLDSVAVMTS